MANIYVSRRFFIGGLASVFASGPRHIFAAAPGLFSGGVPALSFGVLSDVHVGFAKGGKALNPTYSTDTLMQAFMWFRDNGVDAVVIAGDMAHFGIAGELKAVADAWFKVFPGDKAPDGRHVERVFVFGNHDWGGLRRAKNVFSSQDEIKANAIAADPKKWWREIFHEDWSPFFSKTVKGYDFIGAHWCKGDCRGKEEHFTDGLEEYYASLKKPFDPSKPFFHVQHPHPRGTVHGKVWGQDNGVTGKILSAYPNAVAFSGHSHTSLTDERSIWQGAFTSVGCGTLRNISLAAPGTNSLPAGFENGRTPQGPDFTANNSLKAMGVANRMDCRQGQLVRVYADRVVFSRREFIKGVSLGEDLVMPLPAAENRPFEFNGRAAKAKAPEFPDDATLSVCRTKGRIRGTKGEQVSKDKSADVLKLSFPAATMERSTRAWAYEVTVDGPDGFSKKFEFIAPGARFPKTDPRFSAPLDYFIACERLPEKELTFTIHAISCWNKRSKPLTGKFDHSIAAR